ncbi:MAG: gliding motility-associated ABC transporter substrate-binding protein GldG [Bacteroidales bacterium]|nr:gliding motility-associated ABC transporter substrate-binding protein GldG [Bacteroidales bacterium]
MKQPYIRKRVDFRRNSLMQFAMGLVVIILVNIIGSFIFTRFDLTAEKRFTLSEPTRKLLRGLDDIVFFEVYLEGGFPAGFKRLRKETREMLDQFRVYSRFIQYEFINPFEKDKEASQRDVINRLAERGLSPTDLHVSKTEGSTRQVIFPGAIVHHKASEMPVDLFISQMGVSPEEVLNNSIQNLEFNLANTIRKMTVTIKPKVAFTEGHGELSPLETADITRALMEYYSVERVRLDEMLSSLTERRQVDSASTRIVNKYEAIIIAKPDSAFSEKDKFIIDQFVMRGGRVLWLIDPVMASMDSIQFSDATVGIANNLNLDDQLFHYGVRLNNNLVMDLSALPIPLRTGQSGGTPQIEFFPWYYFPVLTPLSEHPVVKNLNAIRTEFISSIDTISVPGITKTILLTSSPYARTVNTPAFITLDVLRNEPDRELFNKPDIPVACLLEGSFGSIYKNRIPPVLMEDKDIGFIERSGPNRMIVIADGDVIKNQVRYSQGRPYPYPLGYDRYTQQTFGNRDLIMNAMNWLVDDMGLIGIRSRELKLRMLDKTRVDSHRVFWQMLNTLLPVIVVVVFGFSLIIYRRWKYTRPAVQDQGG